MRARIVVLISGGGSNLQALIDACQGKHHTVGRLDADIVAVVSNRDDAYGLQRAAQAGIETQVLSHQSYPSREDFDTALREAVSCYSADLVILAGFMRILTPVFLSEFYGRLMNIHPSLLPKYPGLNTHQRAIEAGDSEHGVTVHFVTEELDGGPPIIQAKVPVLDNDSVDQLAQRVLLQEHIIYPIAAQWFVSGRLHLDDGKAILDDQALPSSGMLYSDALLS